MSQEEGQDRGDAEDMVTEAVQKVRTRHDGAECEREGRGNKESKR